MLIFNNINDFLGHEIHIQNWSLEMGEPDL